MAQSQFLSLENFYREASVRVSPINNNSDNNNNKKNSSSQHLRSARPYPKHSRYINLFNMVTLGRRYYYSYLIDEETEAQQGEITCPRSHSE